MGNILICCLGNRLYLSLLQEPIEKPLLQEPIEKPPDWSFVVITVNTSVHVQVFTVTSILFTHNCV